MIMIIEMGINIRWHVDDIEREIFLRYKGTHTYEKNLFE